MQGWRGQTCSTHPHWRRPWACQAEVGAWRAAQPGTALAFARQKVLHQTVNAACLHQCLVCLNLTVLKSIKCKWCVPGVGCQTKPANQLGSAQLRPVCACCQANQPYRSVMGRTVMNASTTSSLTSSRARLCRSTISEATKPTSRAASWQLGRLAGHGQQRHAGTTMQRSQRMRKGECGGQGGPARRRRLRNPAVVPPVSTAISSALISPVSMRPLA